MLRLIKIKDAVPLVVKRLATKKRKYLTVLWYQVSAICALHL